MGRTTRLGLRLTEEEATTLRRVADTKGISMSEVLREYIQQLKILNSWNYYEDQQQMLRAVKEQDWSLVPESYQSPEVEEEMTDAGNSSESERFARLEEMLLAATNSLEQAKAAMEEEKLNRYDRTKKPQVEPGA